jgi:signal peptidase II
MTSSAFGSRQIVLLTAGSVVLLDQIAKYIVVKNIENQPRIDLIQDLFKDGPPWVSLYVTRNTGAAFSFGSSATWIFSLLAVLVIGLIFSLSVKFTNRLWLITLGLMMGGAAGNLVDRIFRDPAIFRGGVVDFIAVEKFAIFNLADVAITLAAISIALLTIFKVDESKKQS